MTLIPVTHLGRITTQHTPLSLLTPEAIRAALAAKETSK